MTTRAVGIGANKLATTWIHRRLGKYPDICASKLKETREKGCEAQNTSVAKQYV